MPTDEQIEQAASMIEGAVENSSQAFGYDVACKPSRLPEPKGLHLQYPRNQGGAYCMATGASEEWWNVEDKKTGHCFTFNSHSAALDFYERNNGK